MEEEHPAGFFFPSLVVTGSAGEMITMIIPLIIQNIESINEKIRLKGCRQTTTGISESEF